MSNASAGLLCFSFLACSACGAEGGGPSRVDVAQDEAAAAVLAREEARRAEEARAAEKSEFCANFTELYCRHSLGCHPEMTPEHLEGCTSRLARYCDTRLQDREFDLELARACFSKTKEWDCSGSLDAIFSESCADVFSLNEAALGESCRYGGRLECQGGSVCRARGLLPSGLLDCEGTCALPVDEGEDCSSAVCDEHLTCVSEEDPRGLTVNVCRIESGGLSMGGTSNLPDASCAPYEQWVESEERCIEKSLPGEPCGGAFGLECLAATCVKSVCEWGQSSPEESCEADGCMAPYVCKKSKTGESRCEVRNNDCNAHPMWLAQ